MTCLTYAAHNQLLQFNKMLQRVLCKMYVYVRATIVLYWNNRSFAITTMLSLHFESTGKGAF